MSLSRGYTIGTEILIGQEIGHCAQHFCRALILLYAVGKKDRDNKKITRSYAGKVEVNASTINDLHER